ncbi:MAG: tRNA1Val (adenine37-N6)-methyltransferase [Clostridiales bacterium]|jgi:tRNA1(Val) A37 N6-methylase TrmN6|nr:tRNA1Val (adenine37-N6)-methyltransferase [Clostridiales bacterium]MDN5283338.1 tRNA1Val (adenine37-N6)-methyltransferase [Candidatus Ozemobacter sp.]
MQQPFIDTDERLDTVPGTDLSLIQKIDGTAFAIDTLLLANFVRFNPDMNFAGDLGSGSGILSFLLKYRKPDLQVTGFEVQDELHELSLRNLELNRKFTGISFEHIDVREIPARMLPESFDLIVSNPPYFPMGNGRLPTRPGRAMARHELNGTLKDFVEAATYLLSYGGKFCLIIPSSRFYEVVEYLKAGNMGLKRLQFIIPKEGEKSHLSLIEAERFYNGKHEPMPNITIHLADGSFSPELKHLFSAGLKVEKNG